MEEELQQLMYNVPIRGEWSGPLPEEREFASVFYRVRPACKSTPPSPRLSCARRLVPAVLCSSYSWSVRSTSAPKTLLRAPPPARSRTSVPLSWRPSCVTRSAPRPLPSWQSTRTSAGSGPPSCGRRPRTRRAAPPLAGPRGERVPPEQPPVRAGAPRCQVPNPPGAGGCPGGRGGHLAPGAVPVLRPHVPLAQRPRGRGGR